MRFLISLKHIFTAIVFSILIYPVMQVNAAYIDITKSVGDEVIDLADPFTIEFSGLSLATSDALITFTVIGDFSNQHEWINLSADGFSFGRWLNHTNDDDSVKGPGQNDSANTDAVPLNEYILPIVGTASIPFDSFLSIVSDGKIAFEFDYNRDPSINSVNNLKVGDFAQVRIEYENTSQVTAISEPTPLLLMIISVVAMILVRRSYVRKSL